MNRVLMRIIVDLAGFLYLSDEDTVQLDAAVEQLENLRAELLTLAPEEREEFRQYLAERLAEEQREGRPPEILEFLSSFAHHFLEEDEDTDEQ